MIRRRALRIAIACACLIGAALGPAPARAAGDTLPPSLLTLRANERVDAMLASREFSGTVLIARGDTVLYQRTSRFTPDAAAGERCGIGLLARSFTAAAIQRLEMRGKLRLEDTLGRFLPDVPNLASVSLDDLLRHRSGVTDFTENAGWPQARSQHVSLEQLAKRVGVPGLAFAPGTSASASQSDYALLARVVEVVSGRPYAEFVSRELLDSLALRQTGPVTARGVSPGWDPGPLPGGAQRPVTCDPGWLAGNADLASTPRDLLRWTLAVLEGGFIDRRVRTHPYGWGLRVRPPLRTIEQGGRSPAGYAAKIVHVLNDRVTVIVLADLQTDAVARLTDDLVLAAEGDSLPPLAPHPTTVLTPAQLAGLAGRYGPGSQFVLTVRTDAQGAWLAGPDGDFLPLDAESPTRFRFRVTDSDVGFDRDSTGRATTLRWNTFGVAPRLP